MKNLLHPVLASALTLASTSAAVPAGWLAPQDPQEDIVRIEHDWPSAIPFSLGVFDQTVVGRYFANHPASSVVVRRGDQLYLSFSPTTFDSVSVAFSAGVEVIGTLPRTAATDVDRLLAVGPTGASVLQMTPGVGFEVVGNPVGSWNSAEELRTVSFDAGGSVMYGAVGYDSVNLQPAVIDQNGNFVMLAPIPAPAGLLDFELMQWGSTGGAPEIVVVTTTGLQVLDSNGSVIHDYPATLTEARLAVIGRGAGPERIATVYRNTGDYRLGSFKPLASGSQFTDYGAFPAAVTDVLAMRVGQIDGDSSEDIVVSTSGHSAWYVLDDVGGFSAPAAIDVLHVAGLQIGGTNACPVELADINDDGRIDAIACDSPRGMLAIHPDIGSSIANAFNSGVLKSIDAPSLQIETLGKLRVFEDQTTPTDSRLDVTVTIDSELPQQAVLAIVWERPSPTAPFSSTPTSATVFDLADIEVDGEHVVPVPIPHNFVNFAGNDFSTQAWPSGEHYLIDLRVVSWNGAVYGWEESQAGAFTVRTQPSGAEQDYGSFILSVLSTPYPETIDSEPKTDPPSGATGNRYCGIGAIRPLPPPVPTATTPPAPPAPQEDN